MIPRDELAAMLGADDGPCDAAIWMVDVDEELAKLASEADGAPDSEARRAMLAELRAMLGDA